MARALIFISCLIVMFGFWKSLSRHGSVPITHNVGWWKLSHFRINDLLVENIQNGSATNNVGKMKITLSGNFVPEDFAVEPFLSQIHLSERFEMRGDAQICVVTVSPIVDMRPSTTSGLEKPKEPHFQEIIQMDIPFWQWGENVVVVSAGGIQKDVVFHLKK